MSRPELRPSEISASCSLMAFLSKKVFPVAVGETQAKSCCPAFFVSSKT